MSPLGSTASLLNGWNILICRCADVTTQRLFIWISGPPTISGIELQPVEGSLGHTTFTSPWSSTHGHRSGQARCDTVAGARLCSWASAPPPCPPRGLPVEHRSGQTYGGSQEYQGATHEMDQREPGAHYLLPFVTRRAASLPGELRKSRTISQVGHLPLSCPAGSSLLRSSGPPAR